ncbi:MAG: phenylalanine--tRNA ligase subunit beta [Defluviitaleaceae bacterium]|nr:phenylalanine--tRNA ligase subunit beta [Defluviitaleaceae bacterium]
MDIPVSWLKSFVGIDVPVRQFMDDITMTGTTAESLTAVGVQLDKIVVGKMLEITKHPNADKLLITKVQIAENLPPLQIVTGATNLNVNDYVPVALDGAVLADGTIIKKGNLRGELSDGMLCSIEELGYTKQDYPESPENGIYVFAEPQPLGADVREILQLVDNIVEFEIYSNRADCQSVLGIAREIAATYGKPLAMPQIQLKEQASGTAADFVKVDINNETLCQRYIARVVKNVVIKPSPQWLRRRLTLSGIRPINNVVDITNYVMLEYGQPLHAFDIDNIADQHIVVRNAKAGEKFVTLDGTERQLDETMLVIADPQKAVAIAGVMGGENSKVTGTASAVLFESANFDATNIRLTSRKLGMRTDSSAKFEKGLDPNLPLTAINRAMELIEELNCGEVVPNMVDKYPNPRTPQTVAYNFGNINQKLGLNLSAKKMEELLALLDISAADGVAVVPTFRPDITSEADIAEEVARMYGYDKIPISHVVDGITGGGKTAEQKAEDTIKTLLAALGYSEALTTSFEGQKIFDKLKIPQDSPLRNAVTINNPLGEDFSIMRTSPLNGILQSLATNFNRRNDYARLFELTKVYLPNETPSQPENQLPNEPIYLTIAAYDKRKMDFFDIKGDLEELFRVLGIKSAGFSANANVPQMHPGRTADVILSETVIGQLGELHPDIAADYEIGTRAYIAVLQLAPIIAAINRTPKYVPLPKFPAIVWDISLQVQEDIAVAALSQAIKEQAGSLLADITLFDVYQGTQLAENFKSVSYTLTFRADDRTLTADELAVPKNAILQHLQANFGATLRDK